MCKHGERPPATRFDFLIEFTHFSLCSRTAAHPKWFFMVPYVCSLFSGLCNNHTIQFDTNANELIEQSRV